MLVVIVNRDWFLVLLTVNLLFLVEFFFICIEIWTASLVCAFDLTEIRLLLYIARLKSSLVVSYLEMWIILWHMFVIAINICR